MVNDVIAMASNWEERLRPQNATSSGDSKGDLGGPWIPQIFAWPPQIFLNFRSSLFG